VKNDKSKIINGSQDDCIIADSFANYFADACSPNSGVRYGHSATAFNDSLQTYLPNDHSLEYSLSVEQVDSIVHKLKLRKAASLDKLTVEHIKYGHPCIILIITKIFNLLCAYKYVPIAFGKSLTFPIPKSYTAKYEDSYQ